MALGTTFFILAILAIGIWVFLEIKRVKHKIVAIVLIGLIIFSYVSFTVSLRNEDVDMRSIEGVIRAGKLYTAWLGAMFKNLKSITAYASKQNWKEYEKDVEVDPKLKTKIKKAEEIKEDIWTKLE